MSDRDDVNPFTSTVMSDICYLPLVLETLESTISLGVWRSRLVRGDREDFRIVCTHVGMISVSHAAVPFQLRLPLALASRSFLPTSEVSSLSLSHRLFRVGEGYRRSPEQRRAQETAR
jgi:hypothetical protein